MSRATNAVARKRRKKKVLKQAKGYWGRKHSSYRFANEQVMRSGNYAYRDRRRRKRDMRRLWIVRINAAARREGMSYSRVHPRPRRGRASRSTARCSRTSPSATPRRSADLPSKPGRPRRPEPGPPQRDFTGRPAGALFCAHGPMITSKDNEKLKLIRRLGGAQAPRARGPLRRRGRGPGRGRRGRRARAASSCCAPAIDVEPELLDAVSTLGSGTRVIGVYPQAWADADDGLLRLPARGRRSRQRRRDHPHGRTRCSAAPVVLGPGCADPFSPKAVRASMGSIFGQPADRGGARVARGRRWSGWSPTAAGRPTTSRSAALCSAASARALPDERRGRAATACGRSRCATGSSR